MIVNCMMTGKQKSTEDVTCVYIRNADTNGDVEIIATNIHGEKEVHVVVDGKELIKAVENAMNV